ncbi:rod-determining factor RdfA [Halorhabdus rudnickae]|uniref:rod-determining factor RdfA n=1 Tax=Halorhabdus rudnickae TaxID=1775544 RepID=UPI001082B691|nr:rod-determining factor RdfA [Halorhabdus rudnickae]
MVDSEQNGSDTRPSESDGCSCKVGRVADRYTLGGLDEELRRRYTAEASLRDLETFVNERILRTAIEQAGEAVPALVSSDRGIGALYEVLRDEEGTAAAEQARLVTRLEQAGVDVDAVTDDWISHATIRTHLNDCLSVDTAREASITPEGAINTVEWARSRSESVVSETVQRLKNADVVEVTEPDVSVSVRITCEACGRSYAVQDLLDAGGCDCNRGDSLDEERE